MQHPPSRTLTTRTAPGLASISGGQMMTTLYYTLILLGLVVLYGRGDFSTAGFIYQAF